MVAPPVHVADGEPVVKLPRGADYASRDSLPAENIPPFYAVVRLPEATISDGQCSVVDSPCIPEPAGPQRTSSDALRETVKFFLPLPKYDFS
jgi:hypothetical protein